MSFPFHILSKILWAKVTNRSTPLFVSWALTDRCNLQCRHCGFWRAPRPELGTEEVLQAIELLTAAGAKVVSFVGGEPFLRNDLASILERCRRKGLFVRVTSNGVLIENHIDAMRYIDVLKLSLDGPKPVHEHMRGEGTFESVFTAKELAEKAGIKVVFNSVLSKMLTDNLDEFLGLLARQGIPTTFQPVEERSRSCAEHVRAIVPERARMREAIRKLIELKYRHPRCVGNSRTVLESLLSWPDPPSQKCYAGLLFFRIDPQGNMCACDRIGGEKVSVRDESGFRDGLRAMRMVGLCDECARNNTMELNRVLSLDPKTIWNVSKRFL